LHIAVLRIGLALALNRRIPLRISLPYVCGTDWLPASCKPLAILAQDREAHQATKGLVGRSKCKAVHAQDLDNQL